MDKELIIGIVCLAIVNLYLLFKNYAHEKEIELLRNNLIALNNVCVALIRGDKVEVEVQENDK